VSEKRWRRDLPRRLPELPHADVPRPLVVALPELPDEEGSLTVKATPMRFAYADPPYPGKARRYYRDHPDYAGEVDHAALIEQLEADYPDGWALSTSAAALQAILPLCPQPIPRGVAGGGVRPQIRVLAWCKPVSQPGGYPSPTYGWEPVILRGGRRDPDLDWPRDWLVGSPDLYTLRAKPAGHVTGAKPAVFLRWLFACLGAHCGDELVDLFPGSGAVATAWEAFTAQLTLPRTSAPPAEVLGAVGVRFVMEAPLIRTTIEPASGSDTRP
jgi:hypothetical protein